MRQHIGITRRRGKDTREEALTVCPQCGTIEPYYVKLTGRWLCQSCPCEEERRQQESREQARQAWQRAQVYRTYDWLKLPWNDLALVERTLDNFYPLREVPDEETKQPYLVNLEKQYQIICAFCLNPQGNLILHGPVGTGKTHLLAAICNELRTAYVPSRFASASDLCQAIAECYQQGRDPEFLYANSINTPLLALDDLGAGSWTQSRQDTIEKIMDGRSKARRATIVSTNNLDELAQFIGIRAYSRLSIEQVLVPMDGPDYRKEL